MMFIKYVRASRTFMALYSVQMNLAQQLWILYSGVSKNVGSDPLIGIDLIFSATGSWMHYLS